MPEQMCLIYFQMLIFAIKESGHGGDRASSVFIAAFKKATGRARRRKADTVSRSTQTEPGANSNISTQTGESVGEAAEQEALMKTSAPGRDLRIVGSADDLPEDAADRRTGGAAFEERMPLEESKVRESITESDLRDLYHGLPKVVADCVRAVFSAVAEFPRFAAVAPHGEEVNGGEASEGAEDLLIEFGPESPEFGEVFCVPLPVYLPAMENIERAFWEELDGRTSCQEELIDEVFLPDETEPAVLDEVDASCEEVAATCALTFHGSQQLASVGKLSTDFVTSEGFPEGVKTKLGLETVREGQPSGVAVQNQAADALQAAMEALSLELSAIVSLEPDEVEGEEATSEEEITEAAFEPLSGQSHEDSCISKGPRGSVFGGEILLPPMDLKNDEQILNEDLHTNDFGFCGVKTTAEFLSRNDVNTEAAGMKTLNETLTCRAIVTSNAEDEKGGLPHDLGSTSSSEWEADSVASQLDEQGNVLDPVFDAVTEF